MYTTILAVLSGAARTVSSNVCKLYACRFTSTYGMYYLWYEVQEVLTNKTPSMWLRYVGDTFSLFITNRIPPTAHQDRHYQNFDKKKQTNLQYRRGCRSWMTLLNSSVPVKRLPDSFHPESNEPKTNVYKGHTSSSINNHIHSLHQRYQWKNQTMPISGGHSGCIQEQNDHEIMRVRQRRPPMGVTYKMPCHECDQVYIGETGRPLITRLKEHQRHCKYGDTNKSAVALHTVIIRILRMLKK